MGDFRYFISVFVEGHNVYMFFATHLHDLATVKAIYRTCDIEVYDIFENARLSPKQVRAEIARAGVFLQKKYEETPPPPPIAEKKISRGKNWARSVLCVETGQIFNTVRECCEVTGIPYMTIINCIKNGNATRNVHFTNAR